MRDDQYLKLMVMSEKLTDVLFDEIDPEAWPAPGKKPVDLTKDERGDRYWSKKNAAATLTLITKVSTLINLVRTPNPGAADESGQTGEVELDIGKEIESAERAASKLLDEVEKQRRKRAFDSHTLGKHGATH